MILLLDGIKKRNEIKVLKLLLEIASMKACNFI